MKKDKKNMKGFYKFYKLQLESENSYYDEGGALIIKNIKCFAPGVYTNTDNENFEITAEYIKNTNWPELLQARPVVLGHQEVTNDNHRWATEGAVKQVWLKESEVYCDIIIQNEELQKDIRDGKYKSVSLSISYDEEEKKITYINHLAIVWLGQVPGSFIYLQKKIKEQTTMNVEQLQKQNMELTAKVKEQEATIKGYEEKEKNHDLKKEKAELATKAKEQAEKDFKAKEAELKKEYELKIEATKLGLELSEKDNVEEKIKDFKLLKVEKVFGKDQPGDLNTLFNLAVEMESEEQKKKNKEQEKSRNLNLAGKEATNEEDNSKSLGDIMQSKANQIKENK